MPDELVNPITHPLLDKQVSDTPELPKHRRESNICQRNKLKHVNTSAFGNLWHLLFYCRISDQSSWEINLSLEIKVTFNKICSAFWDQPTP